MLYTLEAQGSLPPGPHALLVPRTVWCTPGGSRHYEVATVRPRLAGAWGSLRYDLVLIEASRVPAYRVPTPSLLP